MTFEEEAENSRISFLKAAMIAFGITVFSMMSSANIFKLTDSTGKSDNVSADSANGHDLLKGTLNNRPSAGTKDRLYHTTDGNGIYYDDGSSWKQVDKGV